MTLKNVLLINAISSGLTGILLATAPGFFATLFKTNAIAPFAEAGIFLIAFATFVLITALKKPISSKATRIIIAIDITWVIASAITVLSLFSAISIIGSLMIIAIAGWVGLMAFLQNRTLKFR